MIYDTTTEIYEGEEKDRVFFRLERVEDYDDASCATIIRGANRKESWLRHTNHMMDVPDP